MGMNASTTAAPAVTSGAATPDLPSDTESRPLVALPVVGQTLAHSSTSNGETGRAPTWPEPETLQTFLAVHRDYFATLVAYRAARRTRADRAAHSGTSYSRSVHGATSATSPSSRSSTRCQFAELA
jgi:hypothetical protein